MSDEPIKDQEHTADAPAEEVVNEVNVDYKDQYLRAHADYQNLVKETNARRAEWAQMSEIQVLEAFIPVFDNFKKAAAHKPEEDASGWKNWATGITFIQKQFADVLKQFGIEEIETVGKEFDPTLHEAVDEELNEDIPMDQIVREIESGYKKGDKVMKPAKVVVSRQDTSE